MIGLLGEIVSAAARAVVGERSGGVVVNLSGVEAEFEIDDGGLLIDGGRGALGVSDRSADRLVHEVGDEIGAEGCGVVERLDSFAAVKHDGTEEAEVGGGKRTAVNGNGWQAGSGIGDYGATVRIVDGADGELGGAWESDADADEAALQQEAMVGGISGRRDVRAICAVNGGEERILAAGLLEDGIDAGDAQAESIAGKVAGGAGAAVGTEALKEGILFIDGADSIVCGNEASRVAEWEKTGNDNGGGDRGEGETGKEQDETATRQDWKRGAGGAGHQDPPENSAEGGKREPGRVLVPRSQKTGEWAMEGRWKRGEIEVKAQTADNRKIKLQRRGVGGRIPAAS